MKRSVILWLAAFLITAATALYQRMTGPTYPLSGSVVFDEKKISFRLHRSHGGDTDHTVRLPVKDTTVHGSLIWKRYKTDDEWTIVSMRQEEGLLSAELPHQPPAGKLMYYIKLIKENQQADIHADEPVIIRFKGDVPAWALMIHVIAMFGGMLLSARAGLEFLSPSPRYALFSWWTVGLLFVGGLVMGPVVQKYAFDAYWTGWPFGTDLTDNKTIIAFLGWLGAALMIPKSTKPHFLVIAAAVILLIIFLIPHSLLGSELDYSKLPK